LSVGGRCCTECIAPQTGCTRGAARCNRRARSLHDRRNDSAFRSSDLQHGPKRDCARRDFFRMQDAVTNCLPHPPLGPSRPAKMGQIIHNRLRHWRLSADTRQSKRFAGKTAIDGTPTVPRVFVPKNLKSAPVADRNNTVDGQSWKNTKNACTRCDWCIRRLAARKRLRGDSPLRQTHHACAAGMSAIWRPVPSLRTGETPLLPFASVGWQRIASSAFPVRTHLRQSFSRTIPANVWRQTAEAKNQQPSSKTRDLLRPQTTVVRQEDHKARIANQRGRSSLQRARTPLPELTDKSLESQL
jgi:hypothetical protein